MNAIHHPLCNDVLRRPSGTPEEECRDLHILREDVPPIISSFWSPNPEELAAINSGKPIILSVWGVTHPPVLLGVVATTEKTMESVVVNEVTEVPAAVEEPAGQAWRSYCFWSSDIEDLVDQIANSAMGYRPDSRQEFYRDVIVAIRQRLEA